VILLALGVDAGMVMLCRWCHLCCSSGVSGAAAVASVLLQEWCQWCCSSGVSGAAAVSSAVLEPRHDVSEVVLMV
jgi:hypothetical protein